MASNDPQDALSSALTHFASRLESIQDSEALYALRVEFLGKKGLVTQLKSQMGSIEPSARKEFGQAFNRTKGEIEAQLDARQAQLDARARKADLERWVDLSESLEDVSVGSAHPITRTRQELEQIFRRMGFDVADGPHVEHEAFNFDALNILPGHPARDMQDTFVVKTPGRKEGEGLVLRSHTSPVQIRCMLNRELPLRLISPGTVFRRDDDATHSPMFHQIEGIYVDKGVTMADLKATLFDFVNAYYGEGLQVRLRPSYFPFVEPGAEFDMESPFARGKGNKTEWIELGGCGMIHPAVLEAANIDPTVYSGWAFGFGIDRMAMLKYKVRDLRSFFESDQRFMEAFRC